MGPRHVQFTKSQHDIKEKSQHDIKENGLMISNHKKFDLLDVSNKINDIFFIIM